MENTTDSRERFSDRTENYAKYRPGYPKACLDYLVSLGLNKHSAVADIGAGTGIFTRLLVYAAGKIYAIEPNREMRHAAEAALKGYRNVHFIDADAENTTLRNKSVEFITCAQSFHWFDREKAKEEFHRILRWDGKAALIWNVRQTESDDFGREYESLLVRCSRDYKKVDHRNVSDAGFEYFFKDGKYTKTVFDNDQAYDLPGIIGRTLSSSYVPLEGEVNDVLMKGVRRLFNKYNRDGTVTFRIKTEMYTGEV